MKTMFCKRTGQALILCLTLLPLLAVCTSCDKEIRQFKGAYSSKTSGNLLLHKAIPNELDTLHMPETMTVSLSPESGQMRISEIKDAKDGYNLMVSINLLGGDALSFRAKAENDSITLEPLPHVRYIQANVTSEIQMPLGITVSGGGRLYDDVIVFVLDYQGGGLYNNVPYVITESHVDCVATSNN